MSSQHHLVIPRGPVTSIIRHLQDQARERRVNRATGTRITRGPGGTRVRGFGRGNTQSSATSQPPRWL